MRAERLGSYSIAATLAGMPCLSRLKSISRKVCLWPPPMKREDTRPVLLRPPLLRLPNVSDFSGVCLVISSRDTSVMKRRLGVVGLNVLSSMVLDLRVFRHLLAGLQ